MSPKSKIIAAAVQAAPVYLNKEASLEKACRLIAQAAERKADLIALPEAFLSGYPYWVWFKTIGEGVPYAVRLFETSVKVPGPETEALGEAARKHCVEGYAYERMLDRMEAIYRDVCGAH